MVHKADKRAGEAQAMGTGSPTVARHAAAGTRAQRHHLQRADQRMREGQAAGEGAAHIILCSFILKYITLYCIIL